MSGFDAKDFVRRLPKRPGVYRMLDAEGRIVAAADTSSLGEAVSANLAAGTYFLVVASHGAYADVGQYTVTGTAPVATPVPPQPPPPAGSPTPSC